MPLPAQAWRKAVSPEYMTEGIRRTPPPPLAPIQFNIPKAHAETLDNGLKVVVFEESRLPIVSFRLAFMSGDAADPADAVGITSAAASSEERRVGKESRS